MKKIAIVIFFLFSIYCNSQEDLKLLGLMNPETADFIRYGNISLPNPSGELIFDVPLYTIKERNFSMPLYLRYGASGFMPAKRPGIAGLHWHLAAGGVITREVKGSPDDIVGRDSNNASQYVRKGFWVGVNTLQKITKENAFNITNIPTKSGAPSWDVLYDYEPDIFRFNFNGHSGSFVIGNDGTIHILTGGGYKVDLSGMTYQNVTENISGIQSSKIVITTSDGYKYVFGGNTSSMEISKLTSSQQNKQPIFCFIVAWHLTSIISPEGDTITFSYTTNDIHQKYDIDNKSIQAQYVSCGASGGENDVIKMETISEITRIVMLDEIKGNNCRVKFNRARATSFISGDTDYLVNNITIYNTDYIAHKNFDLEYDVNGKYSFLKTVKESGNGTYSFDYNLPLELPLPHTYSVDHWGYWRGEYNYSNPEYVSNCNRPLRSGYVLLVTGDETFDETKNKSTKKDFASISLLNTITYPTGGKTCINYEVNDYSSRLEWVLANSYYATIVNKKDICGGARIAEIYDHNKTGQINKRTFKYKENYAYNLSNLNSSGVLSQWPRYNQYYYNANITPLCWVELSIMIFYSRSFHNNFCNMYEPHITYSEITEIRQDNSYIINKFSTHKTTPDIKDLKEKKWGDDPLALIGMLNIPFFDLCKLNDMSLYRGKLQEKTAYDNLGNTVSREINKYNTNYTDNYVVGIRSAAGIARSYKIYTIPPIITEKEESVKNSGNEIRKNYTYTYNKDGLISQVVEMKSTEEDLMKKYKYVGDYTFSESLTHSDASTIRQMTVKNMVGCLAEEQSLIKKNNEWRLVDAKLIKYKTYSGTIYRPAEEYLLENTSLSSDINESQINTSGALTFHNAYKKRTIYQNYDTKGNPTFITKDDVNKIVYLWGYNYQYLIARIENATYNEVLSNIQGGQTAIDNICSKAKPNFSDFIIFNNLRGSLPNAQIYTYTYKPLVGMLTATDSSGKTVYYEYDAFNRLKCTKDHMGKIIESYNYHYQNQ